MGTLFPTPSQTVGPYWAIGLPWAALGVLDPAGIAISGTLYDGAGAPVNDGLLELWDASSGAFGACGTDAAGGFSFRAARPGVIGGQAPHWALGVFARGVLCRLVTRIYLPDEAANATDPLLCGIADPGARSTMIAARTGTRAQDGLRFDVHLQGQSETAFLAWE